jgi:hypothetical protein
MGPVTWRAVLKGDAYDLDILMEQMGGGLDPRVIKDAAGDVYEDLAVYTPVKRRIRRRPADQRAREGAAKAKRERKRPM